MLTPHVQDFDMGDPIFPSYLEYSLETSDVESFKGIDVFPICCPGLTTVEKDGNIYSMVHCNFGFCLQVTIRKNVIMQPSKGRICLSNLVVDLLINGSVVRDDTAQVTE